ncbi:MAG: DUF6252 family protein [Chitinophagales bacterium]|nr:DUF6252 family protein [Chitinophagales bacterium]
MSRYFYYSLVFLLFISCSKDDTDYKVKFESTSKSSSYTWESEDVEAIILNDSLMIVGENDDKSSISIVVESYKVGDYPFSVSDMKSIVIFDKGGEDKTSKMISTDGIVSITEVNTDKRSISGNFNVNIVNLSSVNQKENISGEFISKYSKY